MSFYILYSSFNTKLQKDCYEYLKQSVEVLRERYLIPQSKVKSLLENRYCLSLSLSPPSLSLPFSFLSLLFFSFSCSLRVKLLANKRDRQVKELLKIGDEACELQNENQMLKVKIQRLEAHCEKLTQK